MTIPSNVKCDRADCKYRGDYIWCFDYPKYHYDKCPLFYSDTANQCKPDHLDHSLTKSKLEGEKDGSRNR